jgi:hypothetical protein
MKNVFMPLFAAVLLLFVSNAVTGYEPLADWTGNLNFLLGAKILEEDDWYPVDEQSEFGVLIDFRQHEWPISIAVDFLASYDARTYYDPFFGEYFDLEGSTFEMDLGVREIIVPQPGINIFFGGGIALITARIKVSGFGPSESDSDSGTGFWVNFGITWTLGEAQAFNIGFDIRYSQAKAEMNGYEGESGGTHAGLILGYHW